MKILVLGGTRFIGRHLIADLLAEGHDVTLLNRGRTNPGLFPRLRLIRADRRADDIRAIDELRQDWDAVIDLSAYFPREVSQALEVFRGRAGRYLFCSTVSVYDFDWDNGLPPKIGEDYPVLSCDEKQAVDTTDASYGARKAECERLILSQRDADLPFAIFRPCGVYGAHDPGGRLAHWIWRAGHDVPYILPENGATVLHRTSALELAAIFTAALRENKILGQAYNAVEARTFTFRETMRILGEHLGTDPLSRAVSLSAAELSEAGIRPWVDLPFWLPGVNLVVDGAKLSRDLSFKRTPSERALALAADDFLAMKIEPTQGLGRTREAELLAARA